MSVMQRMRQRTVYRRFWGKTRRLRCDEEMYLNKLEQADDKIIPAIATIIHRNWKEASNELTTILIDQ
jgi:hypothetical protein